MTPLEAELFNILRCEADHPALAAESLSRVLRCAVGLEPTPDELQRALDSLMTAGRIEGVWSHKVGRRFRVLKSVPQPAA